MEVKTHYDGIRTHVCKICSTEFDNEYEAETCCLPAAEKRFECKICGRRFEERGDAISCCEE